MAIGPLRARVRARAAAIWRLLRGAESPARLGVSVGIGLFIGTLPLYGLHLPLCLVICLPLRLDMPMAYLAANISNPLMAPFLVLAEVQLGALLLRGESLPFSLEAARRVGVAGLMMEAMVGGVVLGAVLALLGGLVAFGIARRGRGEPSAMEQALRRTVSRYLPAPTKDRYYVANKLRMDPIVPQIAALGPLGDVVDAGAGRGQLGLFLLELGNVRSLVGFDFDARKIETARIAAAGQAHFTPGDLRAYQPEPADTLLLIDVLHYLLVEEQDALLTRAAQSLRPGGRLVVRETDARGGMRSTLTHAFEWIATTIGYNRAAQKLGFRPISEIVACLERAGLSCEVQGPPGETPFANYFIVAKAPAAQLETQSG